MKRHLTRVLACYGLGLVLLSAQGQAAPVTPSSQASVLLQLGPEVVSHWQARSGETPSVDQQLQQVRLLLAAAGSGGDDDGFGRAEALLLPLMAAADSTPVEAFYLLAVVKQHQHDFVAALRLLDRVLALQPRHAAAVLQRAQIHLVRAEVEAARADCTQVLNLAGRALGSSCLAQVAAISGKAVPARQLIERLLQSGFYRNEAEHFELLVTAATIAEQVGDVRSAEAGYRTALHLQPASRFLLQHLADLCLRDGRASETVSLLQGRGEGLLSLEQETTLLQALLLSGPAPAAAAQAARLKEKFAAAVRRNPALTLAALQQPDSDASSPYKELARFALSQQDPATALLAARHNWQLQKEPGDLLLLAQAASAAHARATLAEVGAWLQRTLLEDVRIVAILERERGQ